MNISRIYYYYFFREIKNNNSAVISALMSGSTTVLYSVIFCNWKKKIYKRTTTCSLFDLFPRVDFLYENNFVC